MSSGGEALAKGTHVPMSDAIQYVGHTALVGITYLNADGSVCEQVQMHGTVTRLDERGWLVLSRPNGQGEFTFPPRLKPAKPGEYRLRSTGEVIVNPEFIGVYSVGPSAGRPPAASAGDGVEQYRATLEAALGQLRPQITTGRIVGSGMSQFLVVERDERGVEIYGNEQSGVVIDPSIGDELQGEITYPTFVRALDAAVRWLNGCSRNELVAARDH